MKIPLSRRLLACCDFIRPADRVADIGCDHGYLGIHLLVSGKAAAVIASDINEMPLQSAVVNAEKFGVRERMRFYLSDGAGKIPRDFDVLVCAGMGADTMVSILEGAPWLVSGGYRLVLQCQSKTHMLRKYLSSHGWKILEETALREGKFLYTVMHVVRGEEILTPGQCYFSPALGCCGTREAADYLEMITQGLRKAVTGRGDAADPQIVAALRELDMLKGDNV